METFLEVMEIRSMVTELDFCEDFCKNTLIDKDCQDNFCIYIIGVNIETENSGDKE